MSANPEHCINLLQLAKEISCMMNSNSNEIDPRQLQGDDEDGESDDDVEVMGDGEEGIDDDDDDVDELQKADLYAMQQ